MKIPELNSQLAGRYEVHRKLGEGGMGSVFLASRIDGGKKVALKLLLHRHEELRQKFRKEYEILRLFDDPAVPRAFDFGEINGQPFIVMEYVEGDSLKRLIDSKQLPTYETRVSWLKSIAEALKYLHSKKIIFCDLTPGNIIVTTSGDSSAIKLIDFGISIALGDVSSYKPESVEGTAEYMSPEHHNGQLLDFRTDIYSFGVLGFHLLTGELPFDLKDPAHDMTRFLKLRMRHVAGKVPSARGKNSAVSKSLDALLQVCMQKDRKDRYDSMDEIIQRLSRESDTPGKGSWLQTLIRRIS